MSAYTLTCTCRSIHVTKGWWLLGPTEGRGVSQIIPVKLSPAVTWPDSEWSCDTVSSPVLTDRCRGGRGVEDRASAIGQKNIIYNYYELHVYNPLLTVILHNPLLTVILHGHQLVGPEEARDIQYLSSKLFIVPYDH